MQIAFGTNCYNKNSVIYGIYNKKTIINEPINSHCEQFTHAHSK